MTYGCSNRYLLPPAADVFTPRCNYDRREREAGCEGCRERGVNDIASRIRELDAQHGGLRAAARAIDCDAAYLKRLQDGEKTNPSDTMLRKLGLKKIVVYVRENEQEGVSRDTSKRGMTTERDDMENQHEKIKGYRDLTQQEIDMMNEGKALAEQCGAYIAKLRGDTTLDQRWISIGATDLQRGFMAVIRGIAQPTTF